MTGPVFNEGYREFVALAKRHLEPLLGAEGFTASYGYSVGTKRRRIDHLYGETESGATFCADYDELIRRLPRYPSPDGYELGEGQCVDLVVAAKPGRGVTYAQVEGEDLVSAWPGLQLRSGDLERDLLAIRDAMVGLLASWR